MQQSDLLALGFTKNGAIVYLALARLKSADANRLIRLTKLHKKLVYENLERLIDKGLVTFRVEEGRRVYSVAPPHMLVEMFAEQEEQLVAQKRKAEKVAQEISKLVPAFVGPQEATVFRGVKGIKSYYAEILRSGKPYVVFGAPERSLGIMQEHFWLNHLQKKKERKIKARLIFNASLRSYGERIQDALTGVRYFPTNFEPLTETNIQDDRVAIIVWSDEPVLFLIRDKFVAENYQQYFEELWKQAKQ